MFGMHVRSVTVSAKRVQQHIYHPDQLILRTQLLETLSMVRGGNRWGSFMHVLTLELQTITGLMQKESERCMLRVLLGKEQFPGSGGRLDEIFLT